MLIKKLLNSALILTTLSGCVQSSAFLGPAVTGASTGNAYQAGLSLSSNLVVKKATGKTTEPENTTANIHAGERVLNPQEAAAYNSQSDLGGAINRLNTTTAQLVTLMKQNNRITSGISNDFLKGSLTV